MNVKYVIVDVLVILQFVKILSAPLSADVKMGTRGMAVNVRVRPPSTYDVGVSSWVHPVQRLGPWTRVVYLNYQGVL